MSDVPEGYKVSEVGVIPEEWEAKPFVDIVNKYIDYRGRTPKKLGMNWGDGEIISLSANNVQMGYIDFDKDAYFGSLELYKKWMTQGDCQKGDILLTMEAPLGNVAQIPDERRYILSQRVILIRTSGVVPDFLFHLLSGAYLQGELLKNSSGSTAQGIQRQKLDKILIYIPNSPVEQTAIASALSDVDALIAALGQLITKKRNIKHGAMQQLLTGEKRLPGFGGGWKVKRLGEIVREFVNGGTPSTQFENYWNGTIPWITGADILNQEVSVIRRYITHDAVKNSSTNVIEKGHLLLVSRTGVGKLAIAPFDVAISQDFTGIYVKNEELLAEYLYRYFDFNQSTLQSQNQGTSIQGITRDTLSAIPISLPPLPEQQAIAQILTDMDAEIEALEQKQAKYKAIKQGMMQELLTGKTRLV